MVKPYDKFIDIDELLLNNETYLKCSKICASIFERLKNSLDAQQIQILLDYEEALSHKESIIIDMFS